ncbi:hypothetical protein ACFSTI_24115 [Rhizorhabdus histidinilytica]
MTINAGDGWSRRIDDLAPRIARHHVTLLRAPAGHGKSVALDRLRAAVEAGGERCAALLLDKRDADLSRFFRRVAHALGVDPAQPDAAGVAEAVDGEADDDRLSMLFLDGIDEAGDTLPPALSDLILFAPGLRFVIASREGNLPGLAKLRAQDRVAVIGPDQLGFSRAEALAFLGASEDADVMRLVDRCEGWPILLNRPRRPRRRRSAVAGGRGRVGIGRSHRRLPRRTDPRPAAARGRRLPRADGGGVALHARSGAAARARSGRRAIGRAARPRSRPAPGAAAQRPLVSCQSDAPRDAHAALPGADRLGHPQRPPRDRGVDDRA